MSLLNIHYVDQLFWVLIEFDFVLLFFFFIRCVTDNFICNSQIVLMAFFPAANETHRKHFDANQMEYFIYFNENIMFFSHFYDNAYFHELFIDFIAFRYTTFICIVLFLCY